MQKKSFPLIYTSIIFCSLLFISACTDPAPTNGSVSKLSIIDEKVGTGKTVKNGSAVSVHYTGWLYDESQENYKGKKFDSSHDRLTPLEFYVGQKRVIKGWDEGLLGMKPGGKRTLIIPADKAYGSKGAGRAIPPNASLVFDIELLKIN